MIDEDKFHDAVCTAECARDCMVYSYRDAAKLANEARQLTGHILIGDDPMGRALALAAQAVKLEQKIKMMLERVDPMLATSVLHQRSILNKQFS